MKHLLALLIATILSSASILGAPEPLPKAAAKSKAGRVETPAPKQPPLQTVDITKLPEGTEQLEIYLLMGQYERARHPARGAEA